MVAGLAGALQLASPNELAREGPMAWSIDPPQHPVYTLSPPETGQEGNTGSPRESVEVLFLRENCVWGVDPFFCV